MTAMGTFIFDLLSNYGSKMFMGGAIDQFVVFRPRKRSKMPNYAVFLSFWISRDLNMYSRMTRISIFTYPVKLKVLTHS